MSPALNSAPNNTHLPSIVALQCFEAAAESLSFTAAGQALNLTQGAVSRQIKSLETTLGLALFERVKQRLVLTPAGEAYAQEVAEILKRLRQATVQVQASIDRPRLRVGAEPALVNRWLMPLLKTYSENNPLIDIEMVTDLALLYEKQSGFDVGVLFGDGHWPGFKAEQVMAEHLLAVCVPSLLQARGGKALERPGDLVGLPLLHQRSALSASELWWRRFGISEAEIAAMPGQRFENFPTLKEAALQGLGVAILPAYFVASELAAGTLVEACEEGMTCEQAYYLVMPVSGANAAAKNFYESLLSRVQNY